MKRVNHADINFVINPSYVNLANFTIKFYTTNEKDFYIEKNQDDVTTRERQTGVGGVDYIVKLDWSDLITLGEGVMNYKITNNYEDDDRADGEYNTSIERTSNYYIDSNVTVSEEEAESYAQVVAELGDKIDAEIVRSESADTEQSLALNTEIETRQNQVDIIINLIQDISGNTYTKSETSGATEIASALSAKLDATAYTPTDLSNYYTKSEVYNKSEIDNKGYITESGFIKVTNPDTAETKVGLVNSLSQYYNTNIGNGAVIEGDGEIKGNIIASGNYSHAEGISTQANGDYSHAEGNQTIASGFSSHAEGQSTHADGQCSHAEGHLTTANGLNSHAEGYYTQASGDTSHAEGYYTNANGQFCHAEGFYTTASGQYSHTEGYVTQANGQCSHAEGNNTVAVANYSHAEGNNTVAAAKYSHAEGNLTQANGQCSHAEGHLTMASGVSSHAEGYYTVANNDSEHASGQYNASSRGSSTFGDSGNTLFSVGNGTANNARHNAFEIRQNGDIYITSGSTDVKLQDNLGTDLSNYYTKSETSGATEISTALGNKVETSAVTSAVTSASTDSQIPTAKAVFDAIPTGGGKAVSGGTNISVTTGETADTINCTLPIVVTNSFGTGLDLTYGSGNDSQGSRAITLGAYTKTTNNGELAIGRYNVSNTTSAAPMFNNPNKTVFSVGNGTEINARHNAFEIRQNGDIYITSGGTDIKLQDNLGGGGKTVSGGTNISIATGETADTINCTLPITAGTDTKSIAEGASTSANGEYSHAEGTDTEANAICSHAEGASTSANGVYSHAEGQYTITNNDSEHASGQYNASSMGSSLFGDSGNTLFSVGNGTAINARHNAFEIRQNGDIYITSGGTDIKLQDNLGGGEASSAITSGDTNAVAGGAVYDKFDEVEQVTAAALNIINDRLSEDEEVTAAGLNAVNSALGGLKLQQITQSAYEALVTKDASTLYIIVGL